MKRTITLLSILFLMFASCTKDNENSQNQESTILPKKIIKTEGTNTYELILSYNENKILEENNSLDNYKYVYTYTDDLITKKILFKGNIIINVDEYIYDNGKVKNIITTKNSIDKITGVITTYKSKTIYSDNTNGTITEQNYSIDSVTGIETKLPENRILTYANGNLVKEVKNSLSYNTITYKYTYLYEYDNNKNPFKNILGLNKISSNSDVSSSNNVIKTTTLSESSKGSTIVLYPNIYTTYETKYSTNSYLKENKYSYSDGNGGLETYTTQYFYE
ncbi:hypothetical protein [Flavobacterium eburneipallidum]|uniref:hypothetical protein n=1 Tax=Flavobacterium eburneipallidum TaxID=3003263 RepID=UPI0022AC0655|nr:hypothetical protein [Flavobacterium eburneipallidum]